MEFVKNYNELLGETTYTATHTSGLKIIVIVKKGYSKKYATFSTKYGSINTEFVVPGEDKSTKVIDGVAHFLEHKVFEQPDGSNAFDSFAKYGASANAFTSFAVTNYLFSCTDNFYENFEILLDYVQTPFFTDENVEKEKGIIAQEIRMYNDDPNQECFYNCLRGMYHNHPVKVDIAGSVEEIMKTTKELLYKCYNTFYHPSNMAVICVGDLDPQKIGEAVEKHIKKEKAGEIKQVFPDEPKEVKQAYTEAPFEVPRPLFMLGFKDNYTGGNGAELMKREILTSILLEILFGRSSTFYNKLYEEGLINSTFSVGYDYETSFAFAYFSGESDDPKKVSEEVYKTIENAKQVGISNDDFIRTKKLFYGKMISLLNNVENLGNEYMFSYHRGENLFDYPTICANITIDEINNRLNEILCRENTSLSVIIPK